MVVVVGGRHDPTPYRQRGRIRFSIIAMQSVMLKVQLPLALSPLPRGADVGECAAIRRGTILSTGKKKKKRHRPSYAIADLLSVCHPTCCHRSWSRQVSRKDDLIARVSSQLDYNTVNSDYSANPSKEITFLLKKDYVKKKGKTRLQCTVISTLDSKHTTGSS